MKLPHKIPIPTLSALRQAQEEGEGVRACRLSPLWLNPHGELAELTLTMRGLLKPLKARMVSEVEPRGRALKYLQLIAPSPPAGKVGVAPRKDAAA